jgi:hypothetical protein
MAWGYHDDLRYEIRDDAGMRPKTMALEAARQRTPRGLIGR